VPEPEDVTATLEAALTTEVARMYEAVATDPDGDYHFYTGRVAAELYGYQPEDLDAMPAGALAAFAGVGCPVERAKLQPGERRAVGPQGRVVGIELNPVMIEKAGTHARELRCSHAEFRLGRIEEPPVESGYADVVISNGVINLSFRKSQVIKEVFRILRPGGRVSIVDVVSARPLAQSIVNDPKLWAS